MLLVVRFAFIKQIFGMALEILEDLAPAGACAWGFSESKTLDMERH